MRLQRNYHIIILSKSRTITPYYIYMYTKEELSKKNIQELETIAQTLGSSLTQADGAEALVNFIVGDDNPDEAQEPAPKKRTRTVKKKTTESAPATEEAPKKRRTRTVKAKAESEDVSQDNTSAPSQSAEAGEGVAVTDADDAAPKRRRRRTKEEILAAAEAKVAAMSKKTVLEQELSFDTPAETAPALDTTTTTDNFIPEEAALIDSTPDVENDLLARLQAKVQEHNVQNEEAAPKDTVWEGDPGDGTDFIIIKDLPVEDQYADYYDQPAPRTESERRNVVPEPETDGDSSFDFADIISANGVLEVMPDGFGFLRSSDYNYLSSPDDIFLTMQQVKKYSLRTGDVVECRVRPPRDGEKYFALTSITRVNGKKPEEIRDRLSFEHLTPLFPEEKFTLCGGASTTNMSTRIVDLFAPIGKGQRALIVAQPKTGKTILMKDIANAIAENHPEAYLIMLLIDERPEEVTDMARTVKAEVVASTFDEPADHHVKIAGLVLEKAKRLVECGHDVVIFLDSITRLARAYNTVAPASGKVLTGGVDANALQKPKRFFGAARNIERGGSLTIIATALTDTGSKMDEVIFEEFKGTGNMELQLDRSLANKRIFPAVNLVQSSTRRDDLLHDRFTLDRMWITRKHIADMNAVEAMTEMSSHLKRTKDNAEFLTSIGA